MLCTNKVTPIQNSSRYNNYIDVNIANRLKYLINMEILIGINRVYLLDCSKTRFWLTQLIGPFLFAIIIYLMLLDSVQRLTFSVLSNTYCFVVASLMLSGSYLQRNKLRDLFRKMNEFDRQLNLDSKLISPRPMLCFVGILSIFITVALEYMFTTSYLYSYAFFVVVYLGVLAHESEIFFFCTLLHAVLVRIRILKREVAKVFCDKDNTRINLSRRKVIERVKDKVIFDITTLNKSYELLQEISDDLNAIMSFPMVVMFISSGLATIVLLNFTFRSLQMYSNTLFTYIYSTYSIMQCIKITLLIISPCFLSNNTYSEVTAIRRILYDALNRKKEDKLKHRKIKGFYHQTRDNDFVYALWGLIRLDMTLPLSYSGLCATYLVIVLQFSKFFD